MMTETLRAPHPLSMMREAFVMADMAMAPFNLATVRSEPRAADAPPVIVLPGFGGDDPSTLPLRQFLSRKGFQAEGWGLGRNRAGAGLIETFEELSEGWDFDRSRPNNGEGGVPALCDAMAARVLERCAALGVPRVALVGWSLGGTVAREVARDLPDHVAGVITMGTPVRGGPKYTSIAPLFARNGFDLDWVEAQVEQRHETPITQPITAIYSKRDGIVAWRAAIDRHSPDVEHIEVAATHLGLGVNGYVWDIVAERLLRLSQDQG